MKKGNMVLGVVTALGLMIGGVANASACGSCDNGAKCKDPQAVRQFKSETAKLRTVLNEKELELRAVYGMDGIDTNKAAELEAGIAELKGNIRAAGDKLGFASCCIS